MKANGAIRNHLRLWAAAVVCCAGAGAQTRAIDTAHSSMTVHVYKAGVFSAFGHDHEIAAPITSGTVDLTARKVELRANAGALRVMDAKASEKDRFEIQSTMLGPEVLDAARYKEIVFRSTTVEAAGAGGWKLTGDLTLHGATHAVSMDVLEKGGRYTGACKFDFTTFGIKPVKVAGGAVKTKNEIQIDFDIRLVT